MADDYASEYGGGDNATSARVYLNVLLKYLWLVVLLAVAGGVGAWYYAKQQPEVYESRALVLIDLDTPQILRDVMPVVDDAPSQNFWAKREYMETQMRIVKSRAIAERVAERLDLASDREFLGLSSVTDPGELERALSAADAATHVRSAISVEQVEDTTVLLIRARASTARLAADLANTVADVYRQQNLERQLQSADQAESWLDEKYVSLGGELRASEAAMVDFRDDNDLIAVTLEEHVGLSAMLEQTSRQLVDARRDRDRHAAAAERIEELLSDGGFEEADVPAIAENALIQELKADLFAQEVVLADLEERGYLENHPDVRSATRQVALLRDRLNTEVGHVLRANLRLAEEAGAAVVRLESQLREVEGRVQALGRHQVEYASLLREAELNRELFNMIERRREEVALTRNSQHNNVTTLEPATAPGAPVSPNRPLMLILGLLGGVGMGMLAAFGLDVLDGTVKGEHELERDFGLTMLGMIPTIKPAARAEASQRGPARGAKWDADTYVHDFPKSAVAESCRTIRTNLTFLASEAPLRTILITSPGPREGKTTTSLSIGSVMAQSGTRVLVVDSDMRRPRIHRTFGLENRAGLSTMLMDGVAAPEVVQRTQIPNLDVLPSGPVPPNPAELMESPRFREVIEELTSRYDRVIFDSPPITPVTDAAVISSQVDGVLLVVRANTTRRELLRRAIEQLSAVNADILGSVVNDIDITRRTTGYYYYYYRQYGQYYGESEDDVVESAKSA